MVFDELLRLLAFLVASGFLASAIVYMFIEKKNFRVLSVACVVFSLVILSVVSEFHSISINSPFITVETTGRDAQNIIESVAQNAYEKYDLETLQSQGER